jgi:hypothetical protein
MTPPEENNLFELLVIAIASLGLFVLAVVMVVSRAVVLGFRFLRRLAHAPQ